MAKRKKLFWCIICGFLVICLLSASFIFLRKFTDVPAGTNTATEAAAQTAHSATEKVSISDLIQAVVSLKNELNAALNDIKSNDLESAKTRIGAFPQYTRSLRVPIDYSLSLFNGSVPFIQKQLETLQKLLDAVDMAAEKILLPGIDLIQTHPLSEMRVGDGIDTKQLCIYLDFVESIMPDVETLIACANSIDLSLIDNDGEITGYLQTANKVLEFYQADKTIISKVKAIIGAEEDRLYLVAAQNSAEIRASGGFPGSVGTLRIQDGILTLEEFHRVYDILSLGTPKGIKLTNEEIRLFNFLSGMQAPRDADLCPDFERVAQIWAAGYETRNGESVSGIIAMTPHIVQRLLSATGEEIVLSDGSVLNAHNATTVLQHDLYYKYFGKDYVSGRETISDQLFAEAAKKAMQTLMGNLAAADLIKYFEIAKDSCSDRTLLLWMKDAAEQGLIIEMGCSGGLNKDPQKPQAGVYYNCTFPSKMGWFLLMDSKIGTRVQNKDGSYTYPVTVKFTNSITQEQIASASSYITGSLNGSIQGAAYFFAPAGGTVSNFSVSNDASVQKETYHDLELGFIRQLLIAPGKTVTITYDVTTAPGAETPLVISSTPTAQAQLQTAAG